MAKLPRHEIAKVLAERSLGRVSAKSFSEQIAAYLLAEGRTAELEPLLRDIMQYRAEHGIVEVMAVSAHPLSADVHKDIERHVKSIFPDAKQIIVSEELQPDVVGGVRLELPNQQLDLSVRAKLNRFKQLTTAGL
ncbi:MAG TPA: F0F1 ATP synthase subunit delta [Candidatus Saccharimonadales bacterium]